MAKDPAVLFYTSDFLTGTMLMSDEETGQYIKLLCLQHQRGRLTENHMLSICKAKDNEVFSKFTRDENGLYYNDRMEEESIKRKNFTESRKHNGLKGGRPKSEKASGKPNAKPKQNLTEDENEDEDINKIIDRIYTRYPSKCIVKKSSTGKSSKTDKGKIKNLLKEHSESDLISKIDWYVKECKSSKVYMKNFCTFLNNLPDIDNVDTEIKSKNTNKFTLKAHLGETKSFECDTLEEAKVLYHNWCGALIENIKEV